MSRTFSISEAITFGWHTTRKHSGLVFQLVLTILALQVAQSIVGKVLAGTAQGFIALVVLGVLQLLVGIGATVISLKLVRGHSAHYKDIVPAWPLVWRFVLASLVVALAVVCGLILLIIPGIYLLLRYSMVRFAVVDGAGVRESLHISSTLTHGIKLQLLLFFVTLIGLNILGAVALLVGLLVTMPISMLAAAHVYDRLKHKA